MIINQDFNVIDRNNRPPRSDSNYKRDQFKGGANEDFRSSLVTADVVELDAQRLTIKENLKASEVTVTGQASPGDLIDMLKQQLRANPVQALEAQTGKLNAGSARLLDNV